MRGAERQRGHGGLSSGPQSDAQIAQRLCRGLDGLPAGVLPAHLAHSDHFNDPVDAFIAVFAMAASSNVQPPHGWLPSAAWQGIIAKRC
jgi:hypothetical protein